MNLNINQKVYLVSGGAKGIGGAISRVLAEEGAYPVIIDPSLKEGQNLVFEFESNGGIALHIPRRLTDSNAAKEAVEMAFQKFGRIDGVVNNAGVNDGVGLENGSPEAFRGSVEKTLAIITIWYTMHFRTSKHQKEVLSISAAKPQSPDREIQVVIQLQKEANCP